MKNITKINTIASINLFEDTLVINWNAQWFQEDIESLIAQLSSNIKDLVIKEKILGADRETLRLQWLNEYALLLHFDYYSQSCWFEGEDEISISALPMMSKQLERNTEV